MKKDQVECDAFIIDTYKLSSTGEYCAGAITFKGRKKIKAMQWKEIFPTQEEANDFVRRRLGTQGLREAENENEIARKNPR